MNLRAACGRLRDLFRMIDLTCSTPLQIGEKLLTGPRLSIVVLREGGVRSELPREQT